MQSSDDTYETICAVADLSGMSKQAFLRVQNIEKYLLAAYDPYTKYHITKCKVGRGNFQFDSATWEFLRMLSTREISGNRAQEMVNSITQGMTRRSSELFKRILNKDLRMGMGAKSINKAFPGLIPIHDVMLAQLFEANRLKFPCFGSPKIDGVRAKFKNDIFYSRNGHPYIGLNHLKHQLRGIAEELDGELTVPGVSFQIGSGWIRSNELTPNATFNIFELPTIREPFISRLAMMDDLHEVGKDINKVSHKLLHNESEVMEFYKKCRGLGYEGAVIKPYDYIYQGTRSYNWMKMKNLNTVDLEVVGTYEGKGKYVGQMGGVIVLFKGKQNRVGGGWSDKQRKDFYDSPLLIIKKIIEIAYMEETDDGNMRHARFVGFRPDKDQGE
jgi:ATP-dependent DNA ligase